MNSGTWISAPVSRVAGLVPPVERSPCSPPGSVCWTTSSIVTGSSTNSGGALVGRDLDGHVLEQEAGTVAERLRRDRDLVVGLAIHEDVVGAVVVQVGHVAAVDRRGLDLDAGVPGLVDGLAGEHVLQLRAHDAGPLPGLTCWNSMICQSWPSIFSTSPFLKSLVSATYFASPRVEEPPLYDGQCLVGQREQFRCLLAHHERVLDPHTSASGEVHARLDGHRRTGDKCTGRRRADSRRFVDLESDSVAEAVQEQFPRTRPR